MMFRHPQPARRQFEAYLLAASWITGQKPQVNERSLVMLFLAQGERLFFELFTQRTVVRFAQQEEQGISAMVSFLHIRKSPAEKLLSQRRRIFLREGRLRSCQQPGLVNVLGV